ncbi:MAG: shikimate dehydrogenase [Pyrinomonadaceae bacterium]|nr:shikimate dehydrogenase [Pyrinomonadaceae bacterium]
MPLAKSEDGHRLDLYLMKADNSIRICVPVCEQSLGGAEVAIAKAAEIGDIIEVRLDCLDPVQLAGSFRNGEHLFDQSPSPTILTFRPAEQGGHRQLDTKARLFFWLFNRPTSAEFLDIELDLAINSTVFDYGKKVDWTRVICSHHNFVGVPGDLDRVFDRMIQTPARILKIAFRAGDITDCITAFQLLDRARSESREMIAIAMGTAGIATRVLGPCRGAFLTYGALETESATAPGQVTARELRTVYRIDRISRETRIMGLAGLPVTHSISPYMLNAAFESAEFDGVYLPLEVRDISSFVTRMVHPRTREIDWNFLGLSVTAPHKTSVMSCLDWIDPAAEEIGAVNTVLVRGLELHGFNTDADAFISPLVSRIGELREARCAVIGAGGAASAAVWSLRQKGAEVTVFARDANKARLLAERFDSTWKPLDSALFEGFDVVVNATPLGTSGTQETETPATAAQLSGARLAYDLVYNPVETRFLREARDAGCELIGGLEMLVTQAAEQFRLWTAMEAPAEVMPDAAMRALGISGRISE